MDLLKLKYFNAVCTYRTVSGAAEALHISQPSVSSAIKDLETEFGVLLFMREHKGMMLTREGEILFNMSKNLLLEAEKTERIMYELGKKKSVLRLGIPPMIGSVMFPEIYRSFKENLPEVSLEITEGGRFELLKKLEDDSLDMAFLPHDMVLGTSLSHLKVKDFEIMFCTKKDSPLSKLKSVTAEDLLKTPLVLFSDGYFQTEEIKKWFEKSNLNPNVVLKTEQLSTIITHIEKGTLSGFAFRELLEKNPEISLIPPKPSLNISVSLFWKKNSFMSDSMKKFKKHIKNLYHLEEEKNV